MYGSQVLQPRLVGYEPPLQGYPNDPLHRHADETLRWVIRWNTRRAPNISGESEQQALLLYCTAMNNEVPEATFVLAAAEHRKRDGHRAEG